MKMKIMYIGIALLALVGLGLVQYNLNTIRERIEDVRVELQRTIEEMEAIEAEVAAIEVVIEEVENTLTVQGLILPEEQNASEMHVYPVFGSVGSVSTMPVYLSGVEGGVSGFVLELSVGNPKMASIAGVRNVVDGLWRVDKQDDGTVKVGMADIHDKLGEDTRLVFEIDILHLLPGVTPVILSGPLRVDDEMGNSPNVRFVGGEVSSR